MDPLRIIMPPELFAPAAFKHFEGAADIPLVKAGPDIYDFTEPLTWQADVTNTGGALLVTGEVRGFDHPLALQKLGEIEAVMQHAAAAEGCTVEFTSEVFCQAYRVDPAGEAAQLFFGACARAGLEPRMTVTYGGSDNNHFCLHGLQGLVVAPGMNSCHSCQEYTSVDELTRAAKLAEALIRE